MFGDTYISKDNWCDTGERTILQHQIAMGNTAIKNDKNMLIFHGLGSGKTCTSIVMMETLRDSIGNSENIKFVVSTPRAVKIQFEEEFRTCPFSNPNPYNIKVPTELLWRRSDPKAKKKMLDQLEKKFEVQKAKAISKRNVSVITHGQLISEKFIEGITTPIVLVIDEIQSFISETSKSYETLYTMVNYLFNKNLIMRMYVLSATPITNYPNDIGLIIKLLQPNKKIDFSRTRFINEYMQDPDKFYDLIKGHVSYFSSGHPNGFPMKRIIVKEHKLTRTQLNAYIPLFSSVLQKLKQGKNTLKQLEEAANISQDDSMGMVEFNNLSQYCNSSMPSSEVDYSRIDEICPKLKYIADHIEYENQEGTVFVFSRFLDYGSEILIQILKTRGFTEWVPGDTNHNGRKFFYWYSGTNPVTAELARKEFNSVDNIKGQKIRVIIGTQTVSQGVSFNNVRNVHVLNPWWNSASMSQVIARCVRFRSHCASYDSNSTSIPTVNIYRHVSIFSEENVPIIKNSTNILSFMSLDQYQYLLSSKKNLLNGPFNQMLKNGAQDCSVLKNGNIYRLEERIIPSLKNANKWMIYYQNPLNSKKYKLERANNNIPTDDVESIYLDDFEKLKNGDELIEYKISDNGKILERTFETSLVVGKDLSSTLIGLENIKCVS